MIRKAREGAITWLPGIALSDIPQPLPAGISIHVRQSEIGLEIQGIVGALPLQNGDTLQIVPKIGVVNFLRLLFKAQGYQRDLETEYEDFVKYSVDSEENIDEVVARHLFYNAEEILKRGPQHDRIKRRHVGLFAAGEIDPVATAINLKCHKQEPVVYRTMDRTEDIAENRILTEAILRAWPMLNDQGRQLFCNINDQWLKRFSGATDLVADLDCVEEGFANGKYGGPRDYYRRALALSQILLGESGVGFAEAEIIEGDAILLNTADVFEKYLRNVISEAYSAEGYVVTKGGVGAASLYTDGSFELVPDIVVSRNNRAVLIADAKYKTPSSGDHYQMVAYLSGHGVKRGVILSPSFDGDEIAVHEYSTSNKLVVREVQLPMTNLALTEEFLGSLVKHFAAWF